MKIHNWENALKAAAPDPVVGIAHADLVGDKTFRLHVAKVPEAVSAHYHTQGDELYIVQSGLGRLHLGAVNQKGEVSWRSPVEVTTGDCFMIPANTAHQLVNVGGKEQPLILLFGCPDSHLSDDEDRFIVGAP